MSSRHTIAPYPTPEVDDPRPTRAELARDDAAPPLPPEKRQGYPAVTRYVMPPEPLVHLASDGATTLCGLPWEHRVISSGNPTCEDCVRAVTL